jgi:hypothetical protein
MPSKFASGKHSIAQCDRCDQRYMLKELRTQILKTKPWRIKVCKTCWDPDHPQLHLGMFPVNDPQAIRDPRPDVSYYMSGTTGLQDDLTGGNTVDGFGYPASGSRTIQWGWNPVGGARGFDSDLTPNNLICKSQVGTVTIVTS